MTHIGKEYFTSNGSSQFMIFKVPKITAMQYINYSGWHFAIEKMDFKRDTMYSSTLIEVLYYAQEWISVGYHLTDEFYKRYHLLVYIIWSAMLLQNEYQLANHTIHPFHSSAKRLQPDVQYVCITIQYTIQVIGDNICY